LNGTAAIKAAFAQALKGHMRCTPQIASKTSYPEIAADQSLSCDNRADAAALSGSSCAPCPASVII
jgi:hypothetical protein